MRVGNRYGIQNLGADVRPLALRVTANLGSGEQTSPNGLSLRNQTGEPWEVHELKFYMRPQSNTVGRACGGFVQVALALDEFPITDGFVPTWAVSPAHALDIERLSPNWATKGGGATFFGGNIFPLREDGMYYWKLDHPLYVKPGSAIKTQFNHTGLDTTSITVGMTASGRVLPGTARPASIKVPWVSTWQSDFYEALAAGGPQLSQETQLNNPFSGPLTVERFVGRIQQQLQFISSSEQRTLVSEFGTGPFEQLFTVKHFDSMGNVIAPTGTPFRNCYGYRARSWSVRHQLPSLAYHRIELTKAAIANTQYYTPTPGANQITLVRAQVHVSIVGWREEKI